MTDEQFNTIEALPDDERFLAVYRLFLENLASYCSYHKKKDARRLSARQLRTASLRTNVHMEDQQMKNNLPVPPDPYAKPISELRAAAADADQIAVDSATKRLRELAAKGDATPIDPYGWHLAARRAQDIANGKR